MALQQQGWSRMMMILIIAGFVLVNVVILMAKSSNMISPQSSRSLGQEHHAPGGDPQAKAKEEMAAAQQRADEAVKSKKLASAFCDLNNHPGCKPGCVHIPNKGYANKGICVQWPPKNVNLDGDFPTGVVGSPVDGKKVIAFSYYGGCNPRYNGGAVANAVRVAKFFPGWEMRLYHDDSVNQKALAWLGTQPHVKLVHMDTSKVKNKMNWRFLVASDPTVEYFEIRDIDSRVSNRDYQAVMEFVGSGKNFHVLRDHPSHSNYAMSGGMWGGTHAAVPDMESRLTRIGGGGYLADMNFLNAQIWPIAQKSLMQHDSYSCDRYGGGGRPYPTKRIGAEHIGAVFPDGKLDGKERAGDANTVLKSGGCKGRCCT
eukprot:g364.t1